MLEQRGLAVIAGLALATQACAPTPTVRTTTRANDAHFEPQQRAPFAPPPRASAPTGRTVALTVGSGEAQARATALAFVRSLLEGDRGAVHALLAERVVHAVDGRQVARNDEVKRCLSGADPLSYEPDLTIDDLIDVRAVDVRTVREYHDTMPMAVGLQGSDLVVTLPPRAGTANKRRLPCLGRVYVRTGASPRIVALTR